MKPLFKISFKQSCTPSPCPPSKQPLQRIYIRNDQIDGHYSSPFQFTRIKYHYREKSQPCHSSPPEISHTFQRRRINPRRRVETTEKINVSMRNAQLLQERREALSQINKACTRHLTKTELYKLPPKKLLDIIHLRRIRQSALTIWKNWKFYKLTKLYTKMKNALIASTIKIQTVWRKHHQKTMAAQNHAQLLQKKSSAIYHVVNAYKLIKYFQNSTVEKKLKNNITVLEQMGCEQKKRASQVITKTIKAYLLSKQINELTSTTELEGKKERRMSDCLVDIKRASKRGEALTKRCSIFRNGPANADLNSDLLVLKM